MRARLSRRAAIRATLALAGLASVLVAAGLARRLDTPDVATFEVQPGRFVRDVEALGTLKAVKATPIIVPPESGRAQKVAFLARDGAQLARGDVVVEFDPYEAQREEADGRGDLQSAAARVEKARAEGSRDQGALGLDRDLARAELERAETFKFTDTDLFSRFQIVESQLERELIATRVDVSGLKLEASHRLTDAERTLGEIDSGKARRKVAIAQKGLRSLRIEAPHDGLLLLERNWRGDTAYVGATLWPGQKVAELPDLSQLEAKVSVLEADGAGLKAGQRARLTIEGRPGQEFPATVARVEPLARARDWLSPVKYFEATLSLGRTDPAFMKPGQPVRALVRLEEADGVLAVPRGAVFEKDGKRVCWRRRGGRMVPVEIAISRQSVSRVVIESGLAAGDVVALRDPTASRPSVPAPSRGGGGR